ncbi:cellulose binding domain-containing protein [Nocardioides sp. WS12]|uniref:cellulose binding domain-containing protein n=1 Tax=Nocardioides sp. WS12 TaxID=2486272 RepID=UPI0015FE4549|nr:cellulose binding domain-containing protein [Nocardioides sp. WS12]
MTDNDMSRLPALDAFDRQLMLHLRGEIQDRGRRRKSRLRRAVAGAGVLAAAVVAAMTVSLGSPAFAIEQSADGGVVLTINRLEDAGGVTDGLAEHGIRAEVVYGAQSPGRECVGSRSAAAFTTRIDDDALVLRIPPESVLATREGVLRIIATQGSLDSVRVSYDVAGVPCASAPGTGTPGPDPESTPGAPSIEPTHPASTGPDASSSPRPSPSPTKTGDTASPTAEPSPTPGVSRLVVTFTTTSDWDSGYVGQFTLRNPTNHPITDWVLEFELSQAVEIVHHWNAALTRAGTRVTATAVTGTESIPAGSFVTVGFEALGTSRPANCRIDGAPC